MRSIFIIIPLLVISFLVGWFTYAYTHRTPATDIVKEGKEVIARPLEKYSIENLKKADWQTGKLTIEKQIADEKDYTSYLFLFEFNPEVTGKTKKKITGQINIPNMGGPFPLILMFRGYVDQALYTTGTGTRPAAKYFAEHGFITIAPDFLGYADSDSESGNIFETRFQTYTTAISLLKTIEQMKKEKSFIKVSSDVSDSQLITNDLTTYRSMFLWAHSNGGQIALTTLSVTGASYPTTLWAPASKPFPYVVLYYTDGSDDGGKFIRRELSKFEELYDVEKYTYMNYLDTINAPIQIHQGTADDAVPVLWSSELVAKLKQKEKDITYFTYPGADHNLRSVWDSVVEKDVKFFEKER